MGSGRHSDIAIVDELLREIQRRLASMPNDPHTREFRARAATYTRVVGKWLTFPPTAAQRDALLELVMELKTKVTSAMPTMPPTPSR